MIMSSKTVPKHKRTPLGVLLCLGRLAAVLGRGVPWCSRFFGEFFGRSKPLPYGKAESERMRTNGEYPSAKQFFLYIPAKV